MNWCQWVSHIGTKNDPYSNWPNKLLCSIMLLCETSIMKINYYVSSFNRIPLINKRHFWYDCSLLPSKLCAFRNILNECLLENHKIIFEHMRSHGERYSVFNITETIKMTKSKLETVDLESTIAIMSVFLYFFSEVEGKVLIKRNKNESYLTKTEKYNWICVRCTMYSRNKCIYFVLWIFSSISI